MLRPSSAELDAGWALRPMRVDRGRVYPSKALLGSARSSSQTTSDITKNAMASLPQLMPNPCQPSASRLMKSYGYGLPPAAGPDPGQIAARASTKTNTVNPALRKAAEDAAKKARFNAVSGLNNQTGTITYYFNLK